MDDHQTLIFTVLGKLLTEASYGLPITSSTLQVIHTTPITEQQTKVHLSTKLGHGLFFVRIIDSKMNIIHSAKIVLQ